MVVGFLVTLIVYNKIFRKFHSNKLNLIQNSIILEVFILFCFKIHD